MANDKQYDLDELNQKLEKMNDLLKSGEKRFEELLKIVNNLQKAGGKSGMYGSNATSELAKRYEKKVQEEMKLMDKAYQIKSLLIDQEYDRVEQNRKEAQENTRQFILKRRETAELVENAKTRRKEMSLQAKRIEMMGRMASGAGGGLAGFIGMGVGTGAARLAEGGGIAAKKSEGLQERILNYQRMAGTQVKSSIGTPTGKIQSNMLARLEKISPKLASLAFGKEGDDGRKGGALGKGAGMMGKMGGMLGMAGGIGGGLLGGAIMKGLESSPMFQAISKMMSTAFTLILRPVGDFFAAFFKPIAVVLMKWGASNLKEWAKSMKDKTGSIYSMAGEMGKAVVAFFADPIGVIAAAINPLVDFTAYTNKVYDDILKSFGTSNEGLNALGAGVSSGITTLGDDIEDAKPNLTPTEILLGQIAENTDPKNPLNQIPQKMIPGIDDRPVGRPSRTTPFGGYKSKEEQEAELQKAMEESQKNYPLAWAKAQAGITGKALSQEEAAKYIDPKLKTGLSKESMAILQSVENWKATSQKQVEESKKVQAIYASAAELNASSALSNSQMIETYESLNRDAWTATHGYSVTTKDKAGSIANIFASSAVDIASKMQTAKNAMDRAASMFGYKPVSQTTYSQMIQNTTAKYNIRWANGTSRTLDLSPDAVSTYRAMKGVTVTPLANGGVLNEPIFGIGQRTGKGYLMGEAGREYVVPENKMGGTNVVVNVNIDKMASDIDLNKLKPIIERAILETHARRGII